MNPKNPGENLGDQISAGISEQLSDLLQDSEAIKDAAGKAAAGTAEYIRKHPYQTVAVAFAAGLLAGLFLGKKKSE